MKIDEFEFQDKYGNEINPTKNQLVIYIKSLHKQIKDLINLQKQFSGICTYYKYKVKIRYHSDYYCFTDFEGDGVFENDNSVKLKTLCGVELLKIFSEHLIDNELCDFTTDGKTYHFGMFTPTNGSTRDFDYTILEERYGK